LGHATVKNTHIVQGNPAGTTVLSTLVSVTWVPSGSTLVVVVVVSWITIGSGPAGAGTVATEIAAKNQKTIAEIQHFAPVFKVQTPAHKSDCFMRRVNPSKRLFTKRKMPIVAQMVLPRPAHAENHVSTSITIPTIEVQVLNIRAAFNLVSICMLDG